MIKGYYMFNNTKLAIGKQDFINESVDVTVSGETLKCQMFSDEDGDIGFYYLNEAIYFRYVNYK